MTVKGFIRSYGAAVRRAERDQQRRAREAAKYYKQLQKEQEISNAAEATQRYEEYITVLKSIHKDCSSPIDWSQIKNEAAPKEPKPSSEKEQRAKSELENYVPGFFVRIFGLANRKRRALESQLLEAKQNDKRDYEKRLTEFRTEYSEWVKLQSLAAGILSESVSSYKDAVEYFSPLAEINEFGSRVNVEFSQKFVLVDFFVKGSEVVPDYILSQTSTGKLSKKAMPASKFQELYQDYVCSGALRIAREMLAYLPVKFVIINAKADLLNSSTGQIESQCILSVAIPPATLSRLNFETIDPSDSMKNFIHQMKFSKKEGFSPVAQLSPESINI